MKMKGYIFIVVFIMVISLCCKNDFVVKRSGLKVKIYLGACNNRKAVLEITMSVILVSHDL